MIMYCGKCGAKINDDVLFCTECGAKVMRADDDVADKNTAVTPSPPEQTDTVDYESQSIKPDTDAATVSDTAAAAPSESEQTQSAADEPAVVQKSYAKMICPECSAKNDLNRNECIQCGTAINKSRLQRECPICHSVMTNEYAICPTCKWDIVKKQWSSREAHHDWQVTTGAIAPVSYDSPKPSSATPQKTNSSMGCGTIFTIIQVILIVIGLIWFNSSSGKIFMYDTLAYFTNGEDYIETIKHTKVDGLGMDYGALISSTLTNIRWEYFKTANDERIVQLDGKDAFGGDDVCIQFLVTLEADSSYWINVKYIGVNGVSVKDILSAFYQWLE